MKSDRQIKCWLLGQNRQTTYWFWLRLPKYEISLDPYNHGMWIVKPQNTITDNKIGKNFVHFKWNKFKWERKSREKKRAGWIRSIPWFTLPVIIITVIIIISSTCKWNASMLRFIECVPERVITSSNQSAQQPSSGDVIKRANILMHNKNQRKKRADFVAI